MEIRIERKNGKVVAGVVTKAFMKKAEVFGSKEYEMVQKFCEMHPNAELKTKTIKKNPDKKTTKNYTYDNMKKFIVVTKGEDDREYLDKLDKIIEVSKIQNNPYKYVLDWFVSTFPEHKGYDIFTKSKNDESNAENEEQNKASSNIIPLEKAE